jgi:hypothetical protein
MLLLLFDDIFVLLNKYTISKKSQHMCNIYGLNTIIFLYTDFLYTRMYRSGRFYLQTVPKIVAKRQKIGNKKITQTNNL